MEALTFLIIIIVYRIVKILVLKVFVMLRFENSLKFVGNRAKIYINVEVPLLLKAQLTVLLLMMSAHNLRHSPELQNILIFLPFIGYTTLP